MQMDGYDLTAETIKKLPDLNEILANKNITPREAMEKAFIKVFGQETHDYIRQANRKYAEKHPNEPACEPTPDETCLEPELSETDAFRLMCEFPDSPKSELKAIAAARRAAGQPISAHPDDPDPV